MASKAAYFGVILIWSTTPLAIQLSSQGSGFLFGLTARMLIGLFVMYAIVFFTRVRPSLSSSALQTYAISGLSIYFSMSCVYCGSQYIPSGWISVIFGISPIVTGAFSYVLLPEYFLTRKKLMGMMTALFGLFTIFYTGQQNLHQAAFGICAIVVSVLIHSLGAVLIKRIETDISGVESTTGGLTIAAPLLTLTYLLFDHKVPEIMPVSALLAIVYLGIIGSALGFSLYYSILRSFDTVRVSMITLVTPVCALILGLTFNHEPFAVSVLIGTALVIAGLGLYEFDWKKFCREQTAQDEQCSN